MAGVLLDKPSSFVSRRYSGAPVLRGQAAENPNFKFHYTLDTAPPGWEHSQGFITKEVIFLVV